MLMRQAFHSCVPEHLASSQMCHSHHSLGWHHFTNGRRARGAVGALASQLIGKPLCPPGSPSVGVIIGKQMPV
jgi:hypothetical protein